MRLLMNRTHLAALRARLSPHGGQPLIYDLQDTLRQVIEIIEGAYLQEEEKPAMAITEMEKDVYQRGLELGQLFAASFEVKKDSSAHFALGKFYAYQFGYKTDADLTLAFIQGFSKGLSDEPKALPLVNDLSG